MATPLMWKAFQLHDMLYDKILYIHILSCDIQKETFTETKPKTLAWFCLSTLLYMFWATCTLIFILKSQVFKERIIPNYMCHMYLILVLLGIFSLGLNPITILYGSSIHEEYASRIWKFDRFLRRDTRSTGYAASLPIKALFVAGIKLDNKWTNFWVTAWYFQCLFISRIEKTCSPSPEDGLFGTGTGLHSYLHV